MNKKSGWHFCFISSMIWSIIYLFYQGEEALIDFSEDDGLYGSKHLANLWSNEIYQKKNGSFEGHFFWDDGHSPKKKKEKKKTKQKCAM